MPKEDNNKGVKRNYLIELLIILALVALIIQISIKDYPLLVLVIIIVGVSIYIVWKIKWIKTPPFGMSGTFQKIKKLYVYIGKGGLWYIVILILLIILSGIVIFLSKAL